MQIITINHKDYEFEYQRQSLIQNNDNSHRRTIGIVIALSSLLLVIACVTGNISLPNVSLGSIFDPLPVYKNGSGAINGHVITAANESILGTIMVAAAQSDHFTTISTALGPDGKYIFEDLKPGKYMIIAFLPDGNFRVMNNIQVHPNTVQTLNFKI
jgi:hypothetical protein